MYPSIMVMIGDSIGLGFQGYMNDIYGIVDTVTNDTVIVEEPGITVQKLIELGGTSGHLHNVIINWLTIMSWDAIFIIRRAEFLLTT